MGEYKLHILKGINIKIERGDYVSIVGSSGSGKTTVMNMIGLLDKFDSGDILLAGKSVKKFTEEERSYWRGSEIGFVFQNFYLLDKNTVLENVLLPSLYVDVPKAEERAVNLLQGLGLGDRLLHRPSELSGGQRQRVAIARALLTDPNIILADEPTGNLDSKTSHQVMDLFEKLNQMGKTVVVVTHDSEVAKRANRIIKLKDGVVEEVVQNRKRIKYLEDKKEVRVRKNRFIDKLFKLPFLIKYTFKDVILNKVRSALTVLGITIGISSVIIMVSLGKSVEKAISDELSSWGKETIFVMPGDKNKRGGVISIQNFISSFSYKDYLDGRKISDIEGVKKVSVIGQSVAEVSSSSVTKYSTIWICNNSYFEIVDMSLINGKLFTDYDEISKKNVVVLGSKLASTLFARQNPVGKSITIENKSYVVVGVVGKDVPLGAGDSGPINFVFMPFNTAQNNLKNIRIRFFAIKLNSADFASRVEKQIQKLFTTKIMLQTTDDLSQSSSFITGILTLFISVVAGISLVVGGIGIMNIMLVSVKEKVHEVGLRKAIGASNSDIFSLFLVQSVVYTLLGSVLGLSLGVLGAFLGANVLNLPFYVPISIVLISTIISTLVGILFGVYPATEAAKLPPVEALRMEG